MRAIIVLFAATLAVVTAVPVDQERIVGGSAVNIATYPSIVVLMFGTTNTNFRHDCGGAIINQRFVLTAAHCLINSVASNWRIRVGSSLSNSGGVVHAINLLRRHPSFNANTNNNDIATIRTSTAIVYNNNVRRGVFANYNPADNAAAWAAGWGATSFGGAMSTQLRAVRLAIINQARCINLYNGFNVVTVNMLCSGWVSGGRDQCQGDSGGPLYHNGVIVGISSWGRGCGRADSPGVNTRISRYITWINNNI